VTAGFPTTKALAMFGIQEVLQAASVWLSSGVRINHQTTSTTAATQPQDRDSSSRLSVTWKRTRQVYTPAAHPSLLGTKACAHTVAHRLLAFTPQQWSHTRPRRWLGLVDESPHLDTIAPHVENEAPRSRFVFFVSVPSPMVCGQRLVSRGQVSTSLCETATGEEVVLSGANLLSPGA
jgi:hypothetical protein